MLNFSNLTHYEFELLTKDIFERELCIKLRTYAQGKDGGIDIRGYVGNNIIIQAKHYINSSFPNLRTALRKELIKIEKLKPKRYIIVTSFNLSPDNEDEIYEMFQGFIHSKSDIIDINFLDSFLQKDCNMDILKIHSKLWLTSTNILDLIFHKNLDIDSKCFMQDYEEKARLFVNTKAYSDIVNILQNENVVILEGAPGVGKTTLSKMLVAYYCEKGYKFKYASNNSISEIKRGIVETDKEIILLDNFLGQRVDDLSSHFFEELRTLIIFASSYENKKIIINSRSVVLNEALSKNQRFAELLEYYNIHKYEIKVGKLSYFESSQILYNHIYFNKLEPVYYQAIREDKHYLRIIQHKSFNPRIIEYVTRKEKIKGIAANDYFNYILSTLDNPKDIWHDEFKDLSKNDRIFMFTLFTLISYGSINREYADSNILKRCFELRVDKEGSYDTTLDIFGDTIKKLKDGLIKLEISENSMRIGFINPSVEDYIYNYLRKLDAEIKQISGSVLYIEQLLALKKLNAIAIADHVRQKIDDMSFLKLESFSKLNLDYHFLRFIFDYNCKCWEHREIIYDMFYKQNAFSNEREENADLIMDFFFEKDMYDYYNLQRLFSIDSLIIRIYGYLYFDQMVKFIRLHERYIELNKNYNFPDYLLYEIHNMINWEIELDIIHNSKPVLKDGINELKKTFCFDDYIDEEEFEQAFDNAKEIFINKYIKPIIEEKNKCLDFSINIARDIKINTGIILEEIDFHDSLFRSDFDHEYDLDKNIHLSIEDECDVITLIFNEDYLEN